MSRPPKYTPGAPPNAVKPSNPASPFRLHPPAPHPLWSCFLDPHQPPKGPCLFSHQCLPNFYTFSIQGNETRTFTSNTLNEAFFGYNRIEGFSPSSGNFTVPVVNVTGLGVGFGDGFALGDYIQHSYGWRDVLTHIHDISSLTAYPNPRSIGSTDKTMGP